MTEPRAPRWSCVVGLKIFIVGRFFCHAYVCLDVCVVLIVGHGIPSRLLPWESRRRARFFPFSFVLYTLSDQSIARL